MRENLKKITSIFRSPGIAAVARWSKGVHAKIVIICLVTIASTLASLGFTIATKGLVDGAVGSDLSALKSYGILLAVLILGRTALSAGNSLVRLKASSQLQKSMQRAHVFVFPAKDPASGT